MRVDSPIVSIVVPVYNVQDYLDECIESLVNQSLKDIEIICVNDASTDTCLDKLKSWAAKDDRIQVIDLPENRGLGSARNVGIKIARGHYLGFVDSDDYVSTDFYQSLVGASGMEADVVTSNLKKRVGMVNKLVRRFDNTFDLNNQEKIKKDIAAYGCRLWQSIFKRQYIVEKKLFFPDRVFYEDYAIVACMFLLANRVVVVDNKSPYYFYRVRPQSIAHGTFTKQKLYDRLFTAKMMIQNAETHNLIEKYREEFDYQFYRIFYYSTLKLLMFRADRYSFDSVRKVYQEYMSSVGNFPSNSYILNLNHVRLLKLIGKYPVIGKVVRIFKIFS